MLKDMKELYEAPQLEQINLAANVRLASEDDEDHIPVTPSGTDIDIPLIKA